MVDKSNNILVEFINSEGYILTSEEIKDSSIPTPMMSPREIFDRYLEYLKFTSRTDNPYKTYEDFFDALLLKYPQLTFEMGECTDNKMHLGISGIWLNPATAVAKRLAYADLVKAVDQLEDYANGEG